MCLLWLLILSGGLYNVILGCILPRGRVVGGDYGRHMAVCFCCKALRGRVDIRMFVCIQIMEDVSRKSVSLIVLRLQVMSSDGK